MNKPEKQNNNLQYDLDFAPCETQEENRLDPLPDKRLDPLEKLLPEYDLFRQIKVTHLHDASLISEANLSLLEKNKKIYLIDFLKMSGREIFKLKGVGEIRFNQIVRLKRSILDDPYPYLRYYKEQIMERRVPETDSPFIRSFIGQLLLFIQQYQSYLERTKQEEISHLLALFLGQDGAPMDYAAIGKIAGKCPERIRQQLQGVTEDWEKLLNGELLGNIRMSEEIPNALKALREYLYRPLPSYWINAYFRKETQEATRTCCEHFLSLWKLDLLKLSSSEHEDLFILTEKSNKGTYRASLSWLITQMRVSPFWFREEEIERNIEELGPTADKEMIHEILSSHPYIERSIDGCFRLRWEYLGAMKIEIRRILLDAKRPLTRKELLATYNLHCKLCGRKPIVDKQLIPLSDNFFLCQQKSGVWYYNPYGQKKEGVQDFILDYILSQEGLIVWDKLMERISDAGYIHTENTIRAYVSIFCRHGLDDPSIWIHRDYARLYPDIRIRKESHNTKKRASPAYYDQIYRKTVSILCASPGFQARMSEVCAQCLDLLPPNIHKQVIYKIWKCHDSLERFIDPEGKKWLRYHAAETRCP